MRGSLNGLNQHIGLKITAHMRLNIASSSKTLSVKIGSKLGDEGSSKITVQLEANDSVSFRVRLLG